jgi:uncharacterized protein
MNNICSWLFACTLLVLSCKEKKPVPVVVPDPPAIEVVFPEKPLGYVSDFEKLLSAAQVAYLDSIIGLHEKETTNQLAVVTLDLDTARIKSREDLEQFSVKLFNQWGVGVEGKNNGVGLLIAKNLRQVRINVGSGLETKLTTEEAKDIIERLITPRFKEDNYFEGIKDGLNAIFKAIK